MREYRATTEIEASPETIWAILADATSYPEWDPGVDRDDGATEFTVREVFSGPLLSLIGRSIPDMTTTFQEFAAGLKRRAESAG